MNAPMRPPRIMGVYETPFWEAVSRRELRLQRCKACRHTWYPPGPVCPQCLSEEWSFEPVSGRGKVIAWTVFHRAYFKELPVPYAVVSVQLDEGPLLVGNLRGVGPDKISLDMPVHVTFEAAGSKDGEWTIFQWASE